MSVFYSIADALPEFTDDPVDRLRHTLAAHRDTAGDNWAVTATAGGVVRDHDRTGLTYPGVALMRVAEQARARLASDVGR